MNKSKRRFFGVLTIAVVALFAMACVAGFAACGGDECEHEYDEYITTQPTCEEWGEATYTCSKCGDSYTAEVRPLGHDYVVNEDISYDATCVDDGFRYAVCSRCGAVDSGTITATGQHTYVIDADNSTPATCTSAGYNSYICEVCGDTTKPSETVPATGEHQISTWNVTAAASCTTDGTRTGTCELCNTTVTDTIPATGHTVSSWTSTTATCGAGGQKTGTCDVCQTTVTEADPATGEHTYADSWTMSGSTSTRTCSICGATQTRADSSTSGGTTTLRAEAENALIDVDETKMYYWLTGGDVFQGNYITGFGFLFDIQENSTASGGYSVGYLAHEHPTLTFTINSTAAVSATLTLHGVSCDVDARGASSVYGLMTAGINAYSGSDHKILTVNGSSVALSGTFSGADSVFGGNSGLNMDNWGTMTATINLQAGDNTIVLTHDGDGVNFDYIELSTTGSTTMSFIETDNTGLVTYDETWDKYDSLTLEAEDATLTNATESSAAMAVKDYAKVDSSSNATQVSAKVTNFTIGDQITFQVSADAAMTADSITIDASSSGLLAADDIVVTVNDTEVTARLINGMLEIDDVSLTSGTNTIVLTCASANTLTVDNILIDWTYVDATGNGGYVESTLTEIKPST